LERDIHDAEELDTKQEKSSNHGNEAASIDPTSFEAEDFAGLVEDSEPLVMAGGGPFKEQVASSLVAEGRGSQDSASIFAYWRPMRITHRARKDFRRSLLSALR